jgi:hypothetical protein
MSKNLDILQDIMAWLGVAWAVVMSLIILLALLALVCFGVCRLIERLVAIRRRR